MIGSTFTGAADEPGALSSNRTGGRMAPVQEAQFNARQEVSIQSGKKFPRRRGLSRGDVRELGAALMDFAARLEGQGVERPSVVVIDNNNEWLDPKLWQEPHRRLPAWRRLGSECRLSYLQLALHQGYSWVPIHAGPLGNALARSKYGCSPRVVNWTVNLSSELQAVAKEHQDGPARYLRARLTKVISDRMTPFWLAVEFANSGRIHVHGALLWARKSLARLKTLLKRFGGEVDPGFKRQVHLERPESLSRVLGWAHYASKDIVATEAALGRHAVAAPTALIREAKRLHARHQESLLIGRASAQTLVSGERAAS